MSSRAIYDKKQNKYACALGVHKKEQLEVLNNIIEHFEKIRFYDIEKEAEKRQKAIEEEKNSLKRKCKEKERQKGEVEDREKRRKKRNLALSKSSKMEA